MTGRVFTRARFGAIEERGSTFVIGEDGATMNDDHHEPPVTVRYADVVGVGVEPGPKGAADELLVLHAGEGGRLTVRARDWRDGGAAVEAIRATLPAELYFPTPAGARVVETG